MKKSLVLISTIGILFFTACGNKKETSNSIESSQSSTSTTATTDSTYMPEKITIELDQNEIIADKDGKATITGVTEPGARVSIGMGILGDSTEADSEGKFSLKHELSGTSEIELKINSSFDKLSAEDKVKIKPNPEVVEQEEKNSDITQLSDNPTFEQKNILLDMANKQFAIDYPYKGSKIHSSLGVLQDWTPKDGHWFYKAEATVVNEYGAERKCNVEITIIPDSPSSGTVTTLIY